MFALDPAFPTTSRTLGDLAGPPLNERMPPFRAAE